MAGNSIAKVKVTTTTEVILTNGDVLASVTMTACENGGNPLFVTRMAHRSAEQAADDTRAMLGSIYGEVDPKWRERP